MAIHLKLVRRKPGNPVPHVNGKRTPFRNEIHETIVANKSGRLAGWCAALVRERLCRADPGIYAHRGFGLTGLL